MEHKVRVLIKWENDNFFQVTSKKDDEEEVLIVRVEENATLDKIWESVQAIVEISGKKTMKKIYDEMHS